MTLVTAVGSLRGLGSFARTIAVLWCALGVACGGPETTTTTTVALATRPHDPCDGPVLDLGEAAQHCRVEGPHADPPPGDAVSSGVATRSLASGIDAAIAVAFRNETAAPIVLDFPGTLRFEASLWRGTQRVDERWEISGIAGGAIGCRPGADCRTVRVRLAPGGTLTASVPFTARVEVLRDGPARGQIARADGGAIPPGEYRVRVMLPWADPVAGSATGARTTRIVEGPLTIAP